MDDPKPAELGEIILRLGAGSIDAQEPGQLVEKARDVEKHLALVEKPLYDTAKGAARSPSYAFGPQNAAKARRAIPYAKKLINALQLGDLKAAREAGQNINNQFRDVAES
jgi:hypothetical protein